MKNNTITYGDFMIERHIKSPVHKVYSAFANTEEKERWFKGPDDNGTTEHRMDFKIGGTEYNKGKFHDGITHIFEAKYYDIVPNNRIIYAYEMYLDSKRISVSLATIEFIPDGEETKLILHESGAFLDDFDKPQYREAGTQELLNVLEASLVK